MARDDRDVTSPQVELLRPQVALLGEVNEDMLTNLVDGLKAAENDPANGPVTVEISTLGGDAEIGRRMMLEIDLFREALPPRPLLFLGKTIVYSAGTTLMAAFPRENRYLTRDAMLLIHCRQLEKTINISGPIRGSRPLVESLMHQLDTGVRMEEENFWRLIEGSDVSMDELLKKALYNWYVPAQEAFERGLIGGVV